jgi:hypothetical protein
MNKLQEFLELNELSEMYQKNRTKSDLPFPEEDISDDDLLICSFYWDETEEGFTFWQSINYDYLDWLYEKQGRLENVR